MSDVRPLHTHPKYKPRASRDRTISDADALKIAKGLTAQPIEFQHGGGFWPLNVTLEDRRCGYDPRNHRGRGMYAPHRWD